MSTQIGEYTFRAVYSMDMDDFDDQIFAWGVTAAVLCGLFFLFNVNNWYLRVTRGNAVDSIVSGANLSTLFELVNLGAYSVYGFTYLS